MTQFISIAESLRVVKKAHERFLALWAVERLIKDAGCVDRLWADIESPSRQSSSADGEWSINQ